MPECIGGVLCGGEAQTAMTATGCAEVIRLPGVFPGINLQFVGIDAGKSAETMFRLSCLDVGSLLAFGALRDVKADFLAFLERLETVHVDCRKVRKQINATIIGSNKSETLCIVKPFDCTDCHDTFSLLIKQGHPLQVCYNSDSSTG